MEASYDGSTSASVGASVGDENNGASIEASIKTGTTASIAAGLDGNNVTADNFQAR